MMTSSHMDPPGYPLCQPHAEQRSRPAAPDMIYYLFSLSSSADFFQKRATWCGVHLCYITNIPDSRYLLALLLQKPLSRVRSGHLHLPLSEPP